LFVSLKIIDDDADEHPPASGSGKLAVVHLPVVKLGSIVSIQVCVGDVWLGIVWACVLIFVLLRHKIDVGEWCKVQKVERCSFLLPCNLITRSSATAKSTAHPSCLVGVLYDIIGDKRQINS